MMRCLKLDLEGARKKGEEGNGRATAGVCDGFLLSSRPLSLDLSSWRVQLKCAYFYGSRSVDCF